MTQPDSTPQNPAACSKCHLTTIIPELLQPQTRSFRCGPGSTYSLCPRCLAQEHYTTSRNLFIGSIVIFPLLFSVGLLSMSLPFLLTLLIAEPIMIFLHELSHAIAAHAVGLRVFGITLGSGPRLLQFTTKKGFLDIHLIPLEGICWIGMPPHRLHRWRWAIAIAAGPMIHLLALILLVAFCLPNKHNPTPGIHPDVLNALLWLNIFMLMFNLFPHDTKFSTQLMPSDGKQLLALLQPDSISDQTLAVCYQMEIKNCLRQDQIAEAWQYFQRLESLRPDPSIVEQTRLHLLCVSGQWAHAEALAKQWSISLTLPGEQCVPNFWIAMAILYQGKDPALAEPYCQEMLRGLPWDPGIQSIHAVLALAQNRPDQAQAWLDRSDHDDYQEHGIKSLINPHLRAELFRLQSNPTQERRWRAIADKRDPTGNFRIPSAARLQIKPANESI